MSKRIPCIITYEERELGTLVGSLNDVKQKAKEKFSLDRLDMIKVTYEGTEIDEEYFEYLLTIRRS
jgi:CIDE-N domain